MTCCGRASRRRYDNFCATFRISTGVIVSESPNGWQIVTRWNKQIVPVMSLISKNNCRNSSATSLASHLNDALNQIVSSGRESHLKNLSGRQMPMVLLKNHFLKILRE